MPLFLYLCGMIISLHPKNPNPRDLKKVVEILHNDGVIIIPTDTIYAMACRLDSKKGIAKSSGGRFFAVK